MTTMMERLRDALNARDARRPRWPSLGTIRARSRCTRVGGLAGALRWSRTGRRSSRACLTSGRSWSPLRLTAHRVGRVALAGSSPGRLGFRHRGVAIFVVRDGLVAEGRLYMEPVEGDGGDIEAAVQELYKPPPGSSQR